MRTGLLAVLGLLAVAVVTHADGAKGAGAPPRLLPVDEAARQPDFLAFRDSLRSAIARRDTSALLAAVDPNVQVSFGGDDGIAAFRRSWRIDDPASPLWDELGRALALGGSFTQDDLFAAPYVFSRWPDHLDAFEQVAVVGEHVRVRQSPSADAPVIERVDHAILARGPDPDERSGTSAWTSVRLPDGRAGWIASRLVRSPVDYRAIFRRSGAGWLLVAFVPGD